MANTLGHFYKNFQGFTYCSVFKVLCCFATARLIYHIFSRLSTAFFVFISEHSALSQRTLFFVFTVLDVRSTKFDAVSLRFANGLALSSCFAFTKLLSASQGQGISYHPFRQKSTPFFRKIANYFNYTYYNTKWSDSLCHEA